VSAFEQTGSEIVWTGHIGQVRVERYRHADGEEVMREVVGHPGAVAIVAHDDAHLWLVRQPREICGEQAEEIGKAARGWEHLKAIYTSPGFTDERIDLYLATGLSDVERPEVEEDERIEIVAWPLDRLDEAISACEDAKSLVGLLLLRSRRA
jgi:ADP-ribose pyrophosphatase